MTSFSQLQRANSPSSPLKPPVCYINTWKMLPFPLRKAWKRQLAAISTQRKVSQSTPCTRRGTAFECARKSWSLLVLFSPLITPQHQGCCRGHCLKSGSVAPCPWGQTLGLYIISCSANYTLLLSCHRGYSRVRQHLGVLKGKASQKNERIQFSFKLENAEQTGFSLNSL